MKFRTEIDIKPFATKIDYSSRILSLGSCFADGVGGRLKGAKFVACVNPTGVLFNIASICHILERFEGCTKVSVEELERGSEGWFHYDFHSSLSSTDPQCCVDNINRAVESGHNAIRECDWVVITLGTSWVYELKSAGKVVANCHKQPSAMFRRRRLSVEESVEYIERALQGPLHGKKVIFTLSPIRHIADGMAENSLSKSIIRVAIDEIIRKYGDDREVEYFPAYEILMDDLRDYRFYGDDLVHPASMAVEYVWQKFCEAAMSTHTLEYMDRVMEVVRGANHRPKDPRSVGYMNFCQGQLRKIRLLEERGINMESEREYFIKGGCGGGELQKK